MNVLSRIGCAPTITLGMLDHGRRDISRVESRSARGVAPTDFHLLTEWVMAIASRSEVLCAIAGPAAGVREGHPQIGVMLVGGTSLVVGMRAYLNSPAHQKAIIPVAAVGADSARLKSGCNPMFGVVVVAVIGTGGASGGLAVEDGRIIEEGIHPCRVHLSPIDRLFQVLGDRANFLTSSMGARRKMI